MGSPEVNKIYYQTTMVTLYLTNTRFTRPNIQISNYFSPQVKSTLLHIFDVGSPSRMTMKEKMDTFRTLQKFLATEMSGWQFNRFRNNH